MISLIDKVVSGKYTIRRKLKKGGFGAVYVAKDADGNSYAVKFFNAETKENSEMEVKVYKQLKSKNLGEGFVKLYGEGEADGRRYLVMELVGIDLQEMVQSASVKHLSVKTALMVGLQVVDRLQALHQMGYLHCDVKPDNLAVGLSNQCIYLLDFGLAKSIQGQTNAHTAAGTAAFMSCNAHQGKSLTPSDDIESLFYTILYLCEGTLPWMRMSNIHQILLSKRALCRNSFKRNIPAPLFLLLQTTKSHSIDYLQIKFHLLSALEIIGFKNDFIFDWNQSNGKRNSLKKQHFVVNLKEKKQIVGQQQIYQVYKFLNEDKKNNKKLVQPNKQQKITPISSKVKQKILIAKRPLSAIQKKSPSPWQQKMKQIGQMNLMKGPKIVVNYTAKHKI